MGAGGNIMFFALLFRRKLVIPVILCTNILRCCSFQNAFSLGMLLRLKDSGANNAAIAIAQGATRNHNFGLKSRSLEQV